MIHSNENINVVLISGKKQSGKDASASVLIEEFGFKKISFASHLKRISSSITPFFTGVKININDFEDNDFKMKVMENCGITYRQFLQYFGTEFVRKYIDKDFWVKCAVKDIEVLCNVSNNRNFVITDVRFDNEILTFENSIKSIFPNVTIWKYRVERRKSNIIKKVIDHFTEHESETGLDFYSEWNGIINNTGTIEELKNSIRYVAKDILNFNVGKKVDHISIPNVEVFAFDGVTNINGDIYSKDCKISFSGNEIPIHDSFDSHKEIGTASNIRIVDNKVFADIEVNNVSSSILYFKPAVCIRIDDTSFSNSNVIDGDICIMSISPTLFHADKSINSLRSYSYSVRSDF